VVPLHASNSWTYMMLFLSQSLRHSMTETTFTELSCINGRICSSIMTPTQCWSLKWQWTQLCTPLYYILLRKEDYLSSWKEDGTTQQCWSVCTISFQVLSPRVLQ
jgi:hypothetical protein